MFSCTFCAAAPITWHSLLDTINSSDTFNSFQWHLKTHPFQAALSTPDGKLQHVQLIYVTTKKEGKGSPYSITERRVPELNPVLGSQPAGEVSHKPGGRLPLLSGRPAVTTATLKRAATDFAAWWTEAQWVWTVCYPTVSRLRFEPGPFCAWVQHANHSATEPPYYYLWLEYWH